MKGGHELSFTVRASFFLAFWGRNGVHLREEPFGVQIKSSTLLGDFLLGGCGSSFFGADTSNELSVNLSINKKSCIYVKTLIFK